MTQKKMTIKDIARISGYSTATVSRALNDLPGVSRELRSRIIDLCNENGYFPDNAARSLRRKKTFTIGAVLPTLDHAGYARMILAIQNVVTRNGFTLLHTQSNFELEAEYNQTKLLIERGVEGLILVGAVHSENLYKIVRHNRIPCVNTYSYMEDSEFPCVGFDNKTAMYNVVDFLIQMNHRKFAYISGIVAGNDRVSERLNGLRQRLAEERLELADHLFLQARYNILDGFNSMKKLMKNIDEFTALVCGSDILAFGALSACRNYDICVPEQISVIGFDNQQFAQHLWPPLTTSETPGDQMGEISAQMLVENITNGTPMKSTLLETSIVYRKTVSPPSR